MSLIKNEVLLRTYAVLFVVVLAAFIIYGRAVTIHTVEGEYWRSKADSLYVRYMPVKGERGNILADDGSFLATSLPLFELRMDVNSSALTDEVFKQNLDSLAWCLATYVDKRYTVGGYRDLLINERKKGQRYLLIKDNATFEEVEQIRKFPLFRLGRYKGGLIERQKSERIKPFGILASRTIGYNKGDTIKVGLEGAFDRTLSGAEGKQLMQRIGTNWVPINDLAEIAPERGEDVVTTIDVNIQDIAENALKNAVNYHNADNATAVVMEVKTGAIKAIANIGKGAEGLYEDYNYAIGLAYEPGSTFKAISMLSMLEDGLVDLDDTIDLELGKTEFMTHTLRDAHSHKIRETSVRKAFCMSSNVGMAKLMSLNYGSKPEKFVERLKDLKLNQITGIEIEGEAKPYVKEVNTKDGWSGISLPWMSIGYEILLTPLQLLTFYNAIANDGKMMKPYIVSEIQHMGDTKKKFKPFVMKKSIASASTIKKLQELLLGVVEDKEYGTAHSIKTDLYQIAGKTGTSQLDYQHGKERKYRSSFVGYFPADNPMYSCIIVVTNPREFGYTGATIACPIFKAISDKCFGTKLKMQTAINDKPKPVLVSNQLPTRGAGNKKDIESILNFLDIKYKQESETEWAILQTSADTLRLAQRVFKEDVVPNVVGLGLRDALFLLETQGLKPVVVGYGKVRSQSVSPNTPAKNQQVRIFLE